MTPEKIVGCLRYYGPGGRLTGMIPYQNSEEMKADLLADIECGRPVGALVFRRPHEPLAITPEWFSSHCESIQARYQVMNAPGRSERESR